MNASLRDRYEKVQAKDRAEWRKWLQKHHTTSPGIWLVFFKKISGKPTVSYIDAVEEALCFGWIDTTMNPIDEESYMQLFTPRKPKSGWAKTNKDRVERLIAEGLMTAAGFASIETAKQNGSWTALDDVEAGVMPADLEKALKATKGAMAGFRKFSPSGQKYLLYWLNGAKREETRAKRIREIVAGAVAGKNPRA
jgi:uncharacterized protein YdeI (YjbR/CyaY-like superfamily)